MDNLKGQFLISAKHLQDPNFYKTVVLLIEHGDNGAMGLVVNRPSAVNVSHALSGHLEIPEVEDPVFIGGPVEPGGLIVLHDRADLAQSDPVIPGIFVPSSASDFEEVIREATENPKHTSFRVYSGCAGWSPGQLEGELHRGDWYLLPATRDMVFEDDPYTLWEETLKRVAAVIPGTDHGPDHPERN